MEDFAEVRATLLRTEEATLVAEDCKEFFLDLALGVTGRDANVVSLEQKDGLVPCARSLADGKVMPKVVTCIGGNDFSSTFRACIANNMKKVPWRTITTAHTTSPAVRRPCPFGRSSCLITSQIKAAPATASAAALNPAPALGSNQAICFENDLRLRVKMKQRYATQPKAIICKAKATKRSACRGARSCTSETSTARSTSITELAIVEIAVALAMIHIASSSLMSDNVSEA